MLSKIRGIENLRGSQGALRSTPGRDFPEHVLAVRMGPRASGTPALGLPALRGVKNAAFRFGPAMYEGDSGLDSLPEAYFIREYCALGQRGAEGKEGGVHLMRTWSQPGI